MNLYDSINARLQEVNMVQLQGEKSVTTYCWDKSAYRWVESYMGNSKRVFQQYQIVDLLMGIPHVMRKKGSMLIVTLIDPTVRAE